jgi:adenosylcobinamide-GDP ribazoletransferase
MRKILLAFQFLTIIPLRDAGRVPEEELGQTTGVFPLIGLFEGVVLGFITMILSGKLAPEVTAALLVLAQILMNGVLHIDGLADTFDAIASRGDREKRLSIMKDSTLGVAGVVAVVFDILLRFLLFREVLLFGKAGLEYSIILLFPVVARWSMVILAYHGVPARKEGLGQVFASYTGLREVVTATLITLLGIYGAYMINHQLQVLILYMLRMLPLIYILSFASSWFFRRLIGGITGDSFGAVYEINTIIVLLMSVLWL